VCDRSSALKAANIFRTQSLFFCVCGRRSISPPLETVRSPLTRIIVRVHQKYVCMCVHGCVCVYNIHITCILYCILYIYIYIPVDFPTDVRETIWCFQKREEAKSITVTTVIYIYIYLPRRASPFTNLAKSC